MSSGKWRPFCLGLDVLNDTADSTVAPDVEHWPDFKIPEDTPVSHSCDMMCETMEPEFKFKFKCEFIAESNPELLRVVSSLFM